MHSPASVATLTTASQAPFVGQRMRFAETTNYGECYAPVLGVPAVPLVLALVKFTIQYGFCVGRNPSGSVYFPLRHTTAIVRIPLGSLGTPRALVPPVLGVDRITRGRGAPRWLRQQYAVAL